MSDDVLSLHDRHHARLRELLYVLLEHLVARDVDGARAVLSTFTTELRRGLALEDEIVLPAYRPLQPERGPGRADVVDGDHVILLRGIELVQGFLDDLDARQPSDALRPILEGLPHVYRLLGTLEHHTEREQRHVYPVVVPTLGDPARARLRDGLSALVDVEGAS